MHTSQRWNRHVAYDIDHLPDRHDTPLLCEDVTDRDRRWLDRATELATDLDQHWRIYCLIVKGNRIMAGAPCSDRNAPHTCGPRLWEASEHAEAAALRIAGDSARGATAYIARVGKDGKIRHAQPCIRCRPRLEAAGCDWKWTSDIEYIEKKLLGLHGWTGRQLQHT